MERRNILAHRGLWSKPEERNTLAALFAALHQGFGIETDFRDRTKELVVSHDPPANEEVLTAEAFFAEYVRNKSDGRLALNVKSDGLQLLLRELLSANELPRDRYYAFDMSVPDTIGYIRNDIPIYTRMSEYELDRAFADEADGVWVDNFSGNYPQLETARQLLDSNQRVAVVSPELHGRSPEIFWEEIRLAGLANNPNFEICTDFPERVYRILGT